MEQEPPDAMSEPMRHDRSYFHIFPGTRETVTATGLVPEEVRPL